MEMKKRRKVTRAQWIEREIGESVFWNCVTIKSIILIFLHLFVLLFLGER
jgi:hypothetical protein